MTYTVWMLDGEVLASFVPRTRWIPKDDPDRDMIEDNTFRSYGPEESVHHMVDEEELRDLFAAFAVRSIALEEERFEICNSLEFFLRASRPEQRESESEG
ncbi:hypothetical protein JW916_11805 [Candidatus Sumerlaeota bacterium]|nr:hypothetical protein [Candidatus Sumerlaeota bacterium]